MRRILFLLVAVSMLGTLAGCKSRSWSHGICDCDYDDHCSSRAPWVRQGAPAASGSESLPAPAQKLPPGR